MAPSQPPSPSPPEFKIRPFWGADMEQCIRIDRASFHDHWGRREFAAANQTPGVTQLVAHRRLTVVGFIVMQKWPKHFSIWNLAVDPVERRRGVGKALVDRAKCLCLGRGMDKITVDVREHDLGAQLFFKQQGFRAVHQETDKYIADPAIAFEFSRQPAGEDVLRSILEGDGRVVTRDVA